MGRRRFSGLAALVLAVAAVLVASTACTSSGSADPSPSPTASTTPVVFWDTSAPAARAVVDDQVARFEAANPDITVTVEHLAPEDAVTRFSRSAQLAAGAPDVIRLTVGVLPALADPGYLLQLDGTPLAAVRQAAPEQVVSAATWGGRLVGVPLTTGAPAMVGNRALMAQVGITALPRTWQELSALKPRFDRIGIATLAFPQDDAAVLPVLFGYGGSLLGPTGAVTVNDPASVLGMAERVRLQQTGATVPVVTSTSPTLAPGDPDPAHDLFAAGRAAFTIAGPWDLPQLRVGAAVADPDRLLVGPVPAGPVRSSSPLDGSVLSLYAATRVASAAERLVAYLTSPTSQAELAAVGDALPALPEADTLPPAQPATWLRGFRAAATRATPLPEVPRRLELLPPLGRATRQALSGEATPGAALDTAAEQMTALVPSPPS